MGQSIGSVGLSTKLIQNKNQNWTFRSIIYDLHVVGTSSVANLATSSRCEANMLQPNERSQIFAKTNLKDVTFIEPVVHLSLTWDTTENSVIFWVDLNISTNWYIAKQKRVADSNTWLRSFYRLRISCLEIMK